MSHVELHQAWHWTCDECGRNNFARSVTADLSGLTEDEIRNYALQLGIIDVHETEIPEGSFVTVPNTVTCEHCGEQYQTQRSDVDL